MDETAEIRSWKSEIRKKLETRNPKLAAPHVCGGVLAWLGIKQPTAYGSRASFGFQGLGSQLQNPGIAAKWCKALGDFRAFSGSFAFRRRLLQFPLGFRISPEPTGAELRRIRDKVWLGKPTVPRLS